jgi:LysM repeat protein
MFDQLSRYRRLPDVAVPDPRGRTLASRDLRPLPDVTGTFRHTVRAGDRLDQLAFQYYRQVLQWWHIADANPQFLSPLALVGAEPVVTTSFPVTAPGEPPWGPLLQGLAAQPGVENVAVSEVVTLAPAQVVVSGTTVTVQAERFSRAVLVTHNRVQVAAAALAAIVAAAGFQVGPPSAVGQVGQEIVIPPAVSV